MTKQIVQLVDPMTWGQREVMIDRSVQGCIQICSTMPSDFPNPLVQILIEDNELVVQIPCAKEEVRLSESDMLSPQETADAG